MIFAEFQSTIRVAWSSPTMFLMSATCHLFEKRWRESVTTVVAISRGACRHHHHFAILRKIQNFAIYFHHLVCIAASRISHFALYQHPPPNATAMKNQKLTPAALRGKKFRWAMQEPVRQERLVCFVCALFVCVMFIIYAIIYIYIYIYIYI